ncbi:hypothetical protein Tco_1263486 [Tanacetum coccineum]
MTVSHTPKKPPIQRRLSLSFTWYLVIPGSSKSRSGIALHIDDIILSDAHRSTNLNNLSLPFDCELSWTGTTSGLRPYHFTYPERRLTMEEMLYKFIDEGKREHEEMRAFIYCEVKGVTTRGGKTTTQDAQNNDTSVHIEEPQVVNHDEPVESNEVLTNDQPQKTSKPIAQPSNKIQTPPIPFLRRLRKEKEEAQH